MNASPTQSIESQIDQYFASVTSDELQADLRGSDFTFYNTLGRKVFVTRSLGEFDIPLPPLEAVNHTTPVCSPLTRSIEEMPLAA